VYTYILAINLQDRINATDAIPMATFGFLNASGSLITTNVTGYGYWIAETYSTPNATTFTLVSAKNLTACVGSPGLFCYVLTDNLIGSATVGNSTSLFISFRACQNST
jgi:hypothetical protein